MLLMLLLAVVHSAFASKHAPIANLHPASGAAPNKPIVYTLYKHNFIKLASVALRVTRLPVGFLSRYE